MPSGPFVRPKNAATRPSVRADPLFDIKFKPAIIQTTPATMLRIITKTSKPWNKFIRANGLGTLVSSAPHISVRVPLYKKTPTAPINRRRPYKIQRIPRLRMLCAPDCPRTNPTVAWDYKLASLSRSAREIEAVIQTQSGKAFMTIEQQVLEKATRLSS